MITVKSIKPVETAPATAKKTRKLKLYMHMYANRDDTTDMVNANGDSSERIVCECVLSTTKRNATEIEEERGENEYYLGTVELETVITD